MVHDLILCIFLEPSVREKVQKVHANAREGVQTIALEDDVFRHLIAFNHTQYESLASTREKTRERFWDARSLRERSRPSRRVARHSYTHST